MSEKERKDEDKASAAAQDNADKAKKAKKPEKRPVFFARIGRWFRRR